MIFTFPTLRRLWVGLALIYILLIIHLPIYLTQPERGDSLSFRLLAGVNVLVAVGVIVLAWWLRPERIEVLREKVVRWRWVYVFGGLILALLLGLEMRPEWFYAHMAFAAASTLALVYWTFFDGDHVGAQGLAPLQKYVVPTIVLFSILLVTFVRIYGLSEYPEKEVIDEPWLMATAVGYAKTGILSDWINLSVKGTPQHDVPRFLAALGLWLRVAGVGFWEARLFSFLLIIPITIFTALAARNLYGNDHAGWLTAAALFSSAVMMFGGRIRHDIGVTFSLSLSLWLFSLTVGATRESPLQNNNLLHFLAGAAMGSALFSHYNAVAFAPIVTLGLYLPRYLKQLRQGKRWPESGFWLYTLGGLLMSGVVIAIQVLPDLNGFLTNQAPRTASAASSAANSILGHIGNIAKMSQLEFLLLVVAVIAAMWRRKNVDWTLLIILVLGHIMLGYIARTPYKYYIVPMAPIYGILIGALFSEGFKGNNSVGAQGLAPLRHLSFIPVLFFLTINLGLTLDVPLNHLLRGEPLHPPVPPAAQWVLDNIPDDETVLASNVYFLWLADYHFASPLIPIVMPPDQLKQYPTRQAMWDAMHVDVIIADPSAQAYDFIEPLLTPDYLESRGYTLAAEIPDGDNMIKIYRR